MDYKNELLEIKELGQIPQELAEKELWGLYKQVNDKFYVKKFKGGTTDPFTKKNFMFLDMEDIKSQIRCATMDGLACLIEDQEEWILLKTDHDQIVDSRTESIEDQGDVSRPIPEEPKPVIPKPKLLIPDDEEVEEFDFESIIEHDEDGWAFNPPTKKDYSPLDLLSEDDYLDRIPDNLNVCSNFFDHKGKNFDPIEMYNYLTDEFKFNFIVLPAENKIRYQNNGVYILDHVGLIDKVIYKLLRHKGDPAHVARVLRMIKGRCKYGSNRSTAFPALHPEWINVSNGMLHVNSGQLIKHSTFYKEYPNQRSVVQLPINYNVDAKSDEFDEFLKEKLPTDQEVDYLYEVFGYTLLQYLPLKKFFILQGPSNSGKSTTLNVLEAMLGSHNCSSTSLSTIDSHSGRFGVSKLYGKLANIHHENSAYDLDGSGTLKSAVDGQEQDVEEKYASSFKTKLFATIFANTNEPVKSKDQSSGFLNRLVILPFDKVHKPIPNMENDLKRKEVLEGIFARSFEALRDLKRRGFFVETDALKKAKKDNAAGRNPILQFAIYHLRQNMEVMWNGKRRKARVPLDEFYTIYESYRKSEGYEVVDKNVFYKNLEEWTKKDKRCIKLWSDSKRNHNLIEGLVLNDRGYDLVDELRNHEEPKVKLTIDLTIDRNEELA